MELLTKNYSGVFQEGAMKLARCLKRPTCMLLFNFETIQMHSFYIGKL